jgi:Cu/Ag efflux protein CusF
MQNRKRIRSIDGFRMGAFVLALFLVLANPGLVSAHNGVEHVMGTVTMVSAEAVTVETTDKKIVEVGLNSKTKYTRNEKKAAASDLKVGDRVMINAKDVNKKLVADSVKLGATTSKAEHADHSKK